MPTCEQQYIEDLTIFSAKRNTHLDLSVMLSCMARSLAGGIYAPPVLIVKASTPVGSGLGFLGAGSGSGWLVSCLLEASSCLFLKIDYEVLNKSFMLIMTFSSVKQILKVFGDSQWISLLTCP